MKKIILSLTMIVAVAAIVVASTGAFFNDTETSTGNKFVAGEIDLLVDSDAHYNGFVCKQMDGSLYTWQDEDNIPGNEVPTPTVKLHEECDGSWTETNLNNIPGVAYKFFDYSDLKPGDNGENTISLHVNNNDAYMCAYVNNMIDLDNTSSEPELSAGDAPVSSSNVGELSKELHFFAWEDNANTNGNVQCDNKWAGSDTEQILFGNVEGPAYDALNGKIYPMYMPNVNRPNNGALKGGTKTCIGMYWCYGKIDAAQLAQGNLVCSGKDVTNMSQTDSMTADISFYVEQARNNPDFECPVIPTSVITPTNDGDTQG